MLKSITITWSIEGSEFEIKNIDQDDVAEVYGREKEEGVLSLLERFLPQLRANTTAILKLRNEEFIQKHSNIPKTYRAFVEELLYLLEDNVNQSDKEPF